MCGIAGSAEVNGRASRDRLVAMCAAQEHRGPDARGLHVEGPVGLGIQRLAVIDLDGGDQPIYNEDRSVVVVLNGEIYNFQALREGLLERGHRFSTGSDTEVIVHLYEEVGDDLVEHLDGMFCFALWDDRQERLLIARDRVGKKPLHFHQAANGSLTFASELGALMQDVSIPGEVDPASLAEYLCLGYINSPRSIYRSVKKLEPGHRMVWREGRLEIKRWWRLDYAQELVAPDQELEERLRFEVREAVRRRLIADVPLGAFLSGGVDSAIVVSQMAELMSEPVRTFTIGFDVEGYNETAGAREVADRFGTDHTDLTVTPDAMEILPKLIRHFGEPYADSSAIPSFYLAEMTRRHVTVALNGDGGDESFAGYRRHLVGAKTAWLDGVPHGIRGFVARSADRLLRGRDARSRLEYAHRLLSSIGRDGVDRYLSHLSVFDVAERQSLLVGEVASEVPSHRVQALDGPWGSQTGRSALDRILQTDVESYLPGDLLVKMDIATMAYSLEARSPLLDHRVMELAARLPDDAKLRGFGKKWLLREAYRGVIPDKTLDGPKRGFGVPLAAWLRGPLGNLALERLSDASTCGGLIERGEARRIVKEHLAGEADRSAQIWSLLCLDEWSRQSAAR